MTKDEILNFLRSNKRALKEHFGVIRIGLFGSYVRGTQKDDSDIDLAVEIQEENKADNFFRLLHLLEDNFHKKIDMGIESNLKPVVKEFVEKEIEYA